MVVSFFEGLLSCHLKKWTGSSQCLTPRSLAHTLQSNAIHAQGKATVAQPERITGRQDLFGVLNGQDAGVQDGWIGNPGVDPRKVCVCCVYVAAHQFVSGQA